MSLENPINNEHSKPDTGTESKEQPADPKPKVPSPPTHPQAPPSPHSYKITCDKKRDWIDNATLGLEGFGLFVLIVYTIFTGLMYCANKKAAEAAKSAADAANSSNIISREALETVQRAYMVLNNVEHTRAISAAPTGYIWQFYPMWENVGNTPAIATSTHFHAGLADSEPNDEEFIGTGKKFKISQVGPHTHQAGGMVPLPESTVLQARMDDPNRKKFFSWGWFVYKDVLPNTDLHVTEFCWHLTQIVSPTQMKLGKPVPDFNAANLRWENCDEHNCVDKYCKDYSQIVTLLPR